MVVAALVAVKLNTKWLNLLSFPAVIGIYFLGLFLFSDVQKIYLVDTVADVKNSNEIEFVIDHTNDFILVNSKLLTDYINENKKNKIKLSISVRYQWGAISGFHVVGFDEKALPQDFRLMQAGTRGTERNHLFSEYNYSLNF